MLILLYFDWLGTPSELKEWETNLKEACAKTGVEYKGLYSPLNEKWNYVSILETEEYSNFLAMGKSMVKHYKMPHNIADVVLPQIL